MPQLAIRTIDSRSLKKCKSVLEHGGQFDRSRGVQSFDGGYLIYTTIIGDEVEGNLLSSLSELKTIDDSIEVVSVAEGSVVSSGSQASSLRRATEEAVKRLGVKYFDVNGDLKKELLDHVPHRYNIYGKLLLLSSGSFDTSSAFQTLMSSDVDFPSAFYETLADVLDVTHIALNAPISGADENVLRKPTSLVFLYGQFESEVTEESIYHPTEDNFKSDELWATVRQNGIFQTWAPRYTMFSRGNIKEKARVKTFTDVFGKVAVDLYAGIGYFAFSYAKIGASQVLCWEINPWSVEGLLRGAKENKWKTQIVKQDEAWSPEFSDVAKIVVFLEDNACAVDRIVKAKLKYAVRHINLGLLPSSEQGWEIALKIANMSSENDVMLHIHANVAIPLINGWKISTKAVLADLIEPLCTAIVQCVKVEQIKTFAPGVMHVCGDFLISKEVIGR
ncbi:S-adenosyl-L-methionine-dependent methyltransferase [Lipomyces arxii]|uniref:S-adenosyl-L-methionine-dependent methyltransferase n=1 Tax=Lipomyces arxii TaxID=56418 RepID=UPI0034CED6AA